MLEQDAAVMTLELGWGGDEPARSRGREDLAAAGGGGGGARAIRGARRAPAAGRRLDRAGYGLARHGTSSGSQDGRAPGVFRTDRAPRVRKKPPQLRLDRNPVSTLTTATLACEHLSSMGEDGRGAGAVVAVSERSAAALAARFTALEPALRAAAAGLLRGRPASDLDDLVQDTFERALRHVTAGRPAPDNPRAWLVSILRNVFVDRLRARHSEERVRQGHAAEPREDAGAAEPTAPPAWSQVSLDDVRDALPAIDPALRAAFELHYLRGLRYADVASALGIPMNTVASRLHRARQAIRDALVARGEVGR